MTPCFHTNIYKEKYMKYLIMVLLASISLAALEVGSSLPSVTLEGDNGGKLDGTAFTSDSLKGKVHLVFYVDPDEKDLNNELSDAVKAEKFDRSRYGSVAIINMDATWLPNFAIASSLKAKQEKFPDTLYVKDLEKVLVKAWDIADDNSDIILLDKDGRIIYLFEGKLDEEQIQTVIRLIGENI
jgi:YtfJ family uncharacterized protein